MITRWTDYPGPLWRVYSVLATLLVFVSVFVWGPLIMLISVFRHRPWTTWALREIYREFQTMDIDDAHIDSSYNPANPCLLVCNHQSHLDIPVIFHALRGHVRMVAKKELFRIPIFGQCLSLCEFIPIDRGNREAGRKAAQRIAERIRSGLQIWVAPEGTRSPDGKLQNFKSGSFGVAIEAGVPIQPLVVKNAYHALSKRDILTKPGLTIDFEVLPQILATDQTKENRHHLADVTRAAILACLEKPSSASV